MATRWDETWHRLKDWTGGQAKSERLAAQILLGDGYQRLDPSHPLGGPDGGKDALVERNGSVWILAAYFPIGQKPFSDVVAKFATDFAGVSSNAAIGMAFVTNQRLTLSERTKLADAVAGPTDIYHLERVATVLDQPSMSGVRSQFLDIGTSEEQLGAIQSAVEDLARAFTDSHHSSTVEVESGSWSHPIHPLIGRAIEAAEITEFLRARPNVAPSVYVLQGLGGVGKTHLARGVAEKALDGGTFPGGAVFVDLRGYDLDEGSRVLPHQVLGPMIRVLSDDEPDEDPSVLLTQYHSILAELAKDGRRALLVFDNVSSTRQILTILPRASLHRVLITTRNSIAPLLDGVVEKRLAPLTPDDAVELLRQTARISADQVGTEERPYQVLAQLCGYLPLALRIVAAILRSDTETRAVDLIDELSIEAQRLAGLEHEDWAVRPALHSSYVRLQQPEARLFRLLSVHPGPAYSSQSVEHLGQLDRVSAARYMRRLLNANLVERRTGAKWSMHDLARLYAAEAISREEYREERRDGRLAIFEYFKVRTDDASGLLAASRLADQETFESQEDAASWLTVEVDSILACIPEAMQASDFEVAAHLAVSISGFLALRRDFAAALSALEVGCAAARRLEDSTLELGALNNLGLNLSSLGQYEEAKRVFHEGRTLARRIGDRGEEATMLTGLGEVIRNQGSPLTSIGTLRRAVRIRLEDEDVERAGFALTNLAISLREAGEFREAVHILRQAVKFHEATGSGRALASTLAHLGTALSQAGVNPDEAQWSLREAIRLYEAIGDMNGAAMCYLNLGSLMRAGGMADDAHRLYVAAAAVFEQTGDVASEIKAWRNVVHLGSQSGDQRAVVRGSVRLRELGFTR